MKLLYLESPVPPLEGEVHPQSVRHVLLDDVINILDEDAHRDVSQLQGRGVLVIIW